MSIPLLLVGSCFIVSCNADKEASPVKVIVPFAPGGGSDTLARVLVREIETQDPNGPDWVIVNVPGAGGTIGSRRAKNARGDGNTLLFLHDGILTAKFAGQSLYGPEAFAPVAATGKLGMLICVADQNPHESLKGLIDEAASDPETVTFAANIGAPSYFMARLLEKTDGAAQFRFVQSGGGARRFADLSGGHVAASAFSVSEYLNFSEGGIRALAILQNERHPSLPEVPTAKEAGFDIVYSNIQGWWAPLNTSEEVLKERQKVLLAAMNSERMQHYFKEQCIDPLFLDSSELAEAMEKKATQLSLLELSFLRKHLPPLEWGILGAVIIGIILALSGGRRTEESLTKRERNRFAYFQWGVLLLFLASLSLPFSGFVPLGIVFIAVTTLVALGKRRLHLTIATAVLAPTILFLFLSRLLGIEFP